MLIKQYLQVNIGDWLPNLGEYFYCGEGAEKMNSIGILYAVEWDRRRFGVQNTGSQYYH